MTKSNVESVDNPLGVEGALDAPIIYFDEAPVFGMNPSGVPSVLLCTLIHDIGPDGKARTVKKVVAQLRGSLRAYNQLLTDLRQVEALLSRPDTPLN